MASEPALDRIRLALARQDFATAGALAQAALADGESGLLLYRLAALHRQEKGDLHGAADALVRAVSLDADDATLLASAGDALRQVGRLDEALAMLDAAIRRGGGDAASWYGRALALEAMGAPDAALESYRQVVRLAPGTAPGIAGLATASLALGRLAEARHYAQEALALAPDDPTARLALARCAMADGRFADVVSLLEGQHRGDAQALTVLGDALDRLERHDEAYAAYAAAKAHFPLPDAWKGAGSAYSRIKAIQGGIASLTPDRWHRSPAPIPGAAARHVFLLGFPRSGTTLAEQMLASLDRVVTLEERPTLADAEALLGAADLRRIDALPDQEIDALRAAYWQRVREFGVDPAGRNFLDMDPSKAAGLPLIARLFPESRIVVMHRDPRDVVWSCFRRNFVANAVTAEFRSIELAARHYDATMRLIRASLTHLPLKAHVLVYEQLVRDLDGTTQALCAFLGLPWSATMRDFATTAQSRPVLTASAAQVRSQLFDGAAQWRPHAHRLAPVLPLIEPWIDPASLTRRQATP